MLLSPRTSAFMWIPEGFAHGSSSPPTSENVYKATDYYAPQHERSLLWNDPPWRLPGLDRGPGSLGQDTAGKRLADCTRSIEHVRPIRAATARPPHAEVLRRLRRCLSPCAVAVILPFRFVGERWWVTLTASIFRGSASPCALPFVLVQPTSGRPQVLALQAFSVLLLVIPLMGFSPGLGRSCRVRGPTAARSELQRQVLGPGRPRWPPGTGVDRTSSCFRCFKRQPRNSRGVRRLECPPGRRVRPRHAIPVRDVHVPPGLVYPEGTGARTTCTTRWNALGLVDVFNVHPPRRAGPRGGASNGLRDEIVSGACSKDGEGTCQWNAFRRRASRGVAARRTQHQRRIIAATRTSGFELDPWRYLANYRDAFANRRGIWLHFPFGRHGAHRPDPDERRLRAVEFRVGDATPSTT